MISRRALLQNVVLGLAGVALPGRGDVAASAPPFPSGLPDEFLKRASALNYDLNHLWATFSQVEASYQSRNLAALWQVSSVPLLVLNNGKRLQVKSLPQLRKLGRLVFATKIRNAVLQCNFAALFLNNDGAMIGDGELWIKAACEDAKCTKTKFRVTTIDLFS
jgi:hypothetical protein